MSSEPVYVLSGVATPEVHKVLSSKSGKLLFLEPEVTLLVMIS